MTRPSGALVLTLALLVSCGHRVYRGSIEVSYGATTAEKLRIAQSIVTEDRLRLLKSQVRERLPMSTEAQLEGLSITWSKTRIHSFTGQGSRDVVKITVGLRFDDTFTPAPIVAAALGILRPEVSPSTETEGHMLESRR